MVVDLCKTLWPACSYPQKYYREKTDKQIYRLLQANPDWLFELTGLESPGPSIFRSFTFKELEREADGLVVPYDPLQPLTVVEVQFQEDATIYPRIVKEMAAVQIEHQMRPVQGVILFRYPHLDPRTQPWAQVVHACLLRDALSALAVAQPEHPLVAVFQPVLLSNAQTLQQQAVQYYWRIRQSDLPASLKATLVEVFVSWLRQRLPQMSKQEIEDIFMGELPDLEETQSGKDLIAIGERRGEERGGERGKSRGIAEAILLFLQTQQSVPEELRQRIRALPLSRLQTYAASLPGDDRGPARGLADWAPCAINWSRQP